MRYIVLICISLLLVNCGNAEKKKPSSEKEDSKPKEIVKDTDDGIATIVINTNDLMKFNTSKVTVKAGQKVKLTLHHLGKLDKKVMGHNVVILKKNVDIVAFAAKATASRDNDYIPKGTTDVIAHTKMIGGQESTTIEFDAPEVGTYDFICSFPGHAFAMKGKFIVE